MTHMELGLQELDIVTDEQRKAALDAISKIDYATSSAGLITARTLISGGNLVITREEVMAIRAALTEPVVPVIEGLEEALASGQMSKKMAWDVASAYAALQKGETE